MYITIYFNQLTINVLCEYVISSSLLGDLSE